ncbi:MAG TPA: DUF2306 domain-containing protein [Thermoanaerobaculia bacterium]|nr:DUF2306 domain-containing protein [Thermoanaerobaculia bacterium]
MSTVALPAGESLSSFADDALKASARLWFVVTISGQLMMAAYVAWFYGSTAVQGRVEAWNRILTRGYVRGDTAGNVAIVVHLIAAVILIAGGALQLIPQMRDRFPRLHRWTGRVYVVTVFAASLSGLYMTWIRGTRGDLTQHIGGSLNAALIILCAVFALRSAITRRFAAHRRWVLRLFLAVSAAWFYRVGLFFWLLLNDGRSVGFDLQSWQGPTLTFLSFANSLIPLTLLELYVRARTGGGAPGRLAMATALFVLTVAMGIGIFGATIGMWLPIIRAGMLGVAPS